MQCRPHCESRSGVVSEHRQAEKYRNKIFQISGHVQRPGCYEFPFGVYPSGKSLDAAGGMLPGRKFKACYPGGSSCALLTERDLDISMDFDTLAARKSALGQLRSLSWMILPIW